MDPRFVGTVVAPSSITVREGPGSQYPVSNSQVLRNGDTVLIYNITQNDGAYWAEIGNGLYAKVSQGTDQYISYENPYEISTLSGIVDFIDDPGSNPSATGDGSGKAAHSVSVASSKYLTGPRDSDAKGKDPVTYASMRLFGLPYQFNAACDPRYPQISGAVGRSYVQTFFNDAPIMYIIPGEAKFTYSSNNKSSESAAITAHAIISGSQGDLEPLVGLLGKARSKTLQFYDFKETYNDYMHYVNIMCRTVAGFLEIKDTISCGKTQVPLTRYDWRNYRWTTDQYHGITDKIIGGIWNTVKTALNNLMSFGKPEQTKRAANNTEIAVDDVNASADNVKLGELFQSSNFVMFYVDPTSSPTESFTNTTGPSSLQQQLDSVSSSVKEMAFTASSLGGQAAVDTIGDMSSALFDGFAGLGMMGGPVSNVWNKILTTGSSVIKGERIILPEIYQESTYSKDYSLSIHLKTPYGDKLSVFMDVLAPMLHLLALAVPKQATQNTYGSPFLIKCYVPGVFNCNLGIITSITFDKAKNEDAWTVDGLPMEIDVTLTIKDLYTHLSMSPSTDACRFINNSSMIEYLSTVAGLNLITPQVDTKVHMMSSSIIQWYRDIPSNAAAWVNDGIEGLFKSFINL